MNKQGMTHIYTGEGKGKTTAAMGLALRAIGAGWKVCFIQFLKGGRYSEHKMLKQLPGMDFKQFGRPGFIRKRPQPKDRTEAQCGLAAVRAALAGGMYGMVVADEVLVALTLGLLTEAEIRDCVAMRPAGVELVLTGRGATPGLKRLADLVTDMREIKHYYRKGVPARRGIEY